MDLQSQSIDVTQTDKLVEIADSNVTIFQGYYDETTDWQQAKKTKDAQIDFRLSKCEGFQGKLYRGRCDIKCPQSVLYEYVNPTLNEGVLRIKWDKDVSQLKTLKQVNQDTFILQTRTNSAAMGLISPRDFIDLLRIIKTDDFFSINAQSILSDAYPPEEKLVRGWNHPCGIICKKHPDNPNYTQVTTFVQSDIKGMLPKSLVESALPGSMAGLFSNLKGILQKDKKLVD